MNANKLIIIFSFLIYLLICKPSDEIWKEIVDSIEKGKINTPKIKNFFFFEEKNYTKLDINSKKMKYLYNYQDMLYKKYNLSSYIIVVDYLDEKKEAIEECAINIGDNIHKKYNVNVSNAVLAFFSMRSRRVTIRTGVVAKNHVSNFELSEIIKGIGNKMRRERYYSAFIQILEEIESNYKYKSSILISFIKFIWAIFLIFIVNVIIYAIIYVTYYILVYFILIFICALLSYIIDCCKNCTKKSLPNDDKLKKIVYFLKDQKSNKKILTDNCVICLEKINNESEKEIENNNIINNTEEDPTEALLVKENKKNDVSVLKCGHMFHSNCIERWLKNKRECPLCRQKVDPKYNENDAQMVWGVQNEIHCNRYNNIRYSDLFILDFYNTTTYSFGYYLSDSSNYFSQRSSGGHNYHSYSGGGGFLSGGGATGGW